VRSPGRVEVETVRWEERRDGRSAFPPEGQRLPPAPEQLAKFNGEKWKTVGEIFDAFR